MMLIRFNDMTFYGLRFKGYEDYPWKRGKRNEYLDDLIKDGSSVSKVKYKLFIHKHIDECMHVSISYSIVERVFSIVCLVLCVICLFAGVSVLSGAIFGVGLVSLGLSSFHRKRVRNLYMGKFLIKDLTNFIFEQR